jgi:hypothetical protein
MLEQLGLGIVLSMDDQFTPAVNSAMGSFQKLQTGADTMTREVTQSMMRLQNLMLAGFSFREIGQEVESAGTAIVKTFKNMFTGIASTGSQFENFRKQLGVFYGSSEVQNVVNWGTKLAMRTPFQVTDVMTALTSMKAVGVDIRKEFASVDKAGKKYTQSFAEYMGDFLSAFPEKNMNDMIRAVQEAFVGNMTGLQRMFKTPVQAILGRKMKNGLKGDIQGFMEDFVKIANYRAPHMMEQMLGTWEQLTSNIQDAWTNFKKDIADSGAFDSMKRTLMTIFNYVTTIDLNKIAKPLGEVFSTLWKPIDMAVHGIISFVDWVQRLTVAHPIIAKIILGFTGVAGVLMVATGALMKFSGGIIVGITSIVSLVANLRILSTLQRGVLTPAFDAMNLSIGSFVRGLGVVSLVAGGFYVAWQTNLLGFRDKTLDAIARIKKAWGDADLILNGKAFAPHFLSSTGMNTSGLTKFFAQVKGFGDAIGTLLFHKAQNSVQYFTQNQVDMYKRAGILGYVQELTRLKGKVSSFWDGFKKGLSQVYVIAKNFLSFALLPIKGVLKGLQEAYYKIFPNMAPKYGSGGAGYNSSMQQLAQAKMLGTVAGGVLATVLGFKVVKTLSSVISAPFKSLFTWLSKSKSEAKELNTALNNTGKVTHSNYYKSLLQPTIESEKNAKQNDYYKAQLAHRGMSIPKQPDTRTKLQKLKDYWKSYGVHPDIRSGAGGTMGYVNIDPADVYQDYYRDVLSKTTNSGDQLQVKRRPNWLRTLLGDTYYAVDNSGKRRKVGKFGGLANNTADDLVLQLAQQEYYGTNPVLQANTVDAIKHKLPVDNLVGFYKKGLNLKQSSLSYENYEKIIKARTSNVLKGIPEEEYANNINKKFFTNSMFGFMNEGEWNNLTAGKSQEEISQIPELRKKYQQFVLGYDPYLKGYSKDLNSYSQVYQDGKQNWLSKLLFGQKLYTVGTDKNGNYYKNTIARRGGLFRKPSDDGKIKEEGKHGLLGKPLAWAQLGLKNLKGAIELSPVGSFLEDASNFGGSLKDTFSGWGQGIGRTIKKKASSSKLANLFQRSGIHLPSFKTPDFSKLKGFGASAIGGVGKFLFGKKDEEGKRQGGLFKGIGSLAGKGIRGLGKGVGAVGSFALNALPFVGTAVGVGKTIFDSISGGKGMKGFTANLNKMAKDMKSGQFSKDLNGIWKNFSAQAKTAFSAIKIIAGAAWKWIKKDGVKLLGQAWEGIKAGAKLGWAYLQANGATMFGKLVKWILTTGVPMLLKGLWAIGKWIITEFVPFLGKCLWEGFKSIGGWLVGVLKTLFGSLVTKIFGGTVGGKINQTLGLASHHGGLYLSPDEHFAVIKKNETVLPPDKSKGFDRIIKSSSNNKVVAQRNTGGGDIKIDKVEITVQADKLSRADARKQAIMILEELKKLKKEKDIRTYKDIDSEFAL